MKSALWFLAGALVALGGSFLLGMRQESVIPIETHADLDQSLDGLADAIRDAGSFVRGHQWYGSEVEQAEAYRHIVRNLTAALEGKAMMDPDFPFFREINTRSKSGMDNSDQRYLIAMLRGEGVYRVWGTRGSSRRLDFTLYGEDDMSPSISTIETDALHVDANGRFELLIGGPKQEHNWFDTEGFERGVILLRYDGMPVTELPEDQHPIASLVSFDEVAEHLPAGEPRIGSEERAASIALRRNHVQRRFGY